MDADVDRADVGQEEEETENLPLPVNVDAGSRK